MEMRVRTIALLLLVLVLGPLPGFPAGADDERLEAAEMARFQGVWTLVENVVNGYKTPERQVRDWLLVVEGDQYNPGVGEQSIEYTFRVDPTRTPKAIDLIPREGVDRGRVYRGIYAFRGDTLTLCRPLDSEDERPAGFTSRSGSGIYRAVWKRRKD
jgi:uncharacterized protein (TIGR03067 family)